MYKLSIIIAVLNSHEIFSRQIKYLKSLKLPSDIEIIVIDDGSSPRLHPPVYLENLSIYQSNDTRPWSQPCARNTGAQLAHSFILLMTDIDHILSRESILIARDFKGDKMMFPRDWAILTEAGRLSQIYEDLFEWGLTKELYLKRGLQAGMHENTFAMRRAIFLDLLNGYDEKFCGKYGGDDTDLSRRYGQLHKQGLVSRHILGPKIYVYPDPNKDIKKVFHGLRRGEKKIGSVNRQPL